MSKYKKKHLIIDVIFFIILLCLDQYTKYWAVARLKEQASIPLIPGVLELHYLENRGAAFGMLQNQKYFFIFIAVIVMISIGYVIWKIPDQKKYNAMHFILVGIAAGAVGNNLFDRFFLDYVIDFIYVVLINFPIFNFADIYVCVATFLLAILLLFYYKEEDLNFLTFKEKKFREIKNDK